MPAQDIALQITLAVLPRASAIHDPGADVNDCEKVGSRAGKLYGAVLEEVLKAIEKAQK